MWLKHMHGNYTIATIAFTFFTQEPETKKVLWTGRIIVGRDTSSISMRENSFDVGTESWPAAISMDTLHVEQKCNESPERSRVGWW